RLAHFQEGERVTGDVEIEQKINTEARRHQNYPEPMPLPSSPGKVLVSRLDGEGWNQNHAISARRPGSGPQNARQPPPFPTCCQDGTECKRKKEAFRIADVQKIRGGKN